jgi:uncharacterized membrane protein
MLGLVAAVPSSAAPVCEVCAQAEFRALGSVQPPAMYSVAYGVSADGSTVVGTSLWRAFRWRAATGMVALEDPLPPPWQATAVACSADGSVAVGWVIDETEPFQTGYPQRAVAWSASGRATLLHDDWILPKSLARCVSADGSMIVGSRQFLPTVWTSPTEQHAISSSPGGAMAVTPDGQYIVGATGESATPFRWSQASGLQAIAQVHGVANAVSADGRTIVGTVIPTQAFIWTALDGLTLLGGLPASGALAVSGDGDRVVGAGSTPQGNGAFVYEADTGVRSLRVLLVKQHGLAEELAGWTLLRARGISADGTVIVGNGTHPAAPNGDGEAFRAVLPRCPGDYDRDGAFTPADVVAFVAAWFDSLAAGNDWGDFDLDDQVTPADVASFVKAWYAAATGACP